MDKTELPLGCGCLVVIFNVILGAWCFSYDLWALTGKVVPWYIDAICGLFGGEITVPLALIMWILSFFGLHYPLFHV